MSTTNIGQGAEAAVAEYLAEEGYEIIDRNWKTPFSEIDIVVKRDKTVYFVEVKYRGSLVSGDGFDYITTKKLHHMTRAAEAWVLEHNWTGPYELIAAAVSGLGNEIEIEIRTLF